jgi:hypothetical protein
MFWEIENLLLAEFLIKMNENLQWSWDYTCVPYE